jgi:hypothetical protein
LLDFLTLLVSTTTTTFASHEAPNFIDLTIKILKNILNKKNVVNNRKK